MRTPSMLLTLLISAGISAVIEMADDENEVDLVHALTHLMIENFPSPDVVLAGSNAAAMMLVTLRADPIELSLVRFEKIDGRWTFGVGSGMSELQAGTFSRCLQLLCYQVNFSIDAVDARDAGRELPNLDERIQDFVGLASGVTDEDLCIFVRAQLVVAAEIAQALSLERATS